MSDHHRGLCEVLPAKAVDIYHARPDINQNPPREQLPPLSSLFGSTSQPRPTNLSYSDRHGLAFPPVSPRENRHPPTPTIPDRTYDASGFQRPPVSRKYSYSSGSDQTERPTFPSPRTVQGGMRPTSPRFESSYGSAEGSRTRQPAVNGWSPQSDVSRQEYFQRDTSSSFRPRSDQHTSHPTQPQRGNPETRTSYHNVSYGVPATPSYPTTPASTVSGDPNSTKDSLGPKIWTGTQFLPRFVRQAEVPGEGLCYFYDDGTHCKTVIDGEIVNAHWGVTKAGKPRKRLAIACITCREKKIKCDPDYPRCVQCEKFGRICKFKNAPRGGQGTPDTPPADPEDILPRPVSSRADAQSFKVEKRENSHSVSPRQTLRQATPDSETHHSKRQRNGFNDFTPVASETSPHPSIGESASPPTPWVEPIMTSSLDRTLLRDWQTNPYVTDPTVVAELISIFFKHVPERLHCMFPERSFKSWVLSTSEKSLDDLMLIYNILCLATVFSSNPEHKCRGIKYAVIARYGCENRHFSIQLVQSRLILALYYYAINSPNDSWDFLGSAVRAASALKLNLEIEKTDDAFVQTFPFGLTRHGYAECRRRTFWSCYLMDRFSGSCAGHVSIIHAEDVFLKFPLDAQSYEMQAGNENPYFEVTTTPIQNTNGTIGSMAYLINIASILGDVMANIYRTSQRPSSCVGSSSSFYDSATQRLRAWKESLPAYYNFSPEALKRATDAGTLDTYVTMHAVYHTATMKLNRYDQLPCLTEAQIHRRVSVAQQHAQTLLGFVDTFGEFRASLPSIMNSRCHTEHSTAETKFTPPFLGLAIVSAIDILTAKVAVSSVPALIASLGQAQSILAELTQYWQSSKSIQILLQQRVRDLVQLGEQSITGAREFGREIDVGVFEMREPIEKMFSKDYDCVYA